MSTKCQFAVSGCGARGSPAQLAMEASERPLSSFSTNRAAGSESRCWAISATIEWPSGPHANAGLTKAQLNAAANAIDLMPGPRYVETGNDLRHRQDARSITPSPARGGSWLIHAGAPDLTSL